MLTGFFQEYGPLNWCSDLFVFPVEYIAQVLAVTFEDVLLPVLLNDSIYFKSTGEIIGILYLCWKLWKDLVEVDTLGSAETKLIGPVIESLDILNIYAFGYFNRMDDTVLWYLNGHNAVSLIKGGHSKKEILSKGNSKYQLRDIHCLAAVVTVVNNAELSSVLIFRYDHDVVLLVLHDQFTGAGESYLMQLDEVQIIYGDFVVTDEIEPRGAQG